MKRTKRLLSVFLTLCLLLGMLPTTARAASALEITDQPSASNDYTVTATYTGQNMTQGFQWYKKVAAATTYTLVQENPQAGQLAVDKVFSGSYTDGHWAAEDEKAPLSVSFLSSPNDEITVKVLSGGDAPEEADGNITFTETGVNSGVYTATSTGGMLQIYIDNSKWTSAITATITVKRCWTPVAGQTSASLKASESGTYYCAVSKDGEGAITNTVDVVVPHSSHPVCGETCSHSGAHEDVTWTALTQADFNKHTNGVTYTYNDWNSKYYTLAAGNYYLAENITIEAYVRILSNTTVNLCLNGKKLSDKQYSSIPNYFLEVGGTLNLCSCADEGGEVETKSATVCIQISNSKVTVNLHNVKVIGKGSGINNNGTLTVSGGEVKGGQYRGISNLGNAKLTLIGSPKISGPNEDLQIETADGTTLENAQVDATRYTGGTLKVKEFDQWGSLTDKKIGAYAIKGGGEGKFTLTNSCYKYEYENGGMVIRGNHTGGTATCTARAVCDVCKQEYGDLAAHTWGGTYEKDANQHWQKCSVCQTETVRANHTGGTATCTAKAVCTACGQEYGNLAPHDFSGAYQSDAGGHWHKCENCDATDTKAAHVYTNDTDTTCNTCGYTRTVAPDKGEIKGEVETKQDTPPVTVDTSTLEELAGTPAANETITVKLTVEKQDNAEGKDDIEELITAGKKDDVLYLDLSLLKITESGGSSSEVKLTDVSKVLEITVPYNFTGKKDVTVYRYHDGAAGSLKEEDTKTDGTFSLDKSGGTITIYASKFSTYAIAYTPDSGGNQPQPPSGGGGTGGGTPPYTGGGGGYVPPTYPVALPASTPGGKLTASPMNASSGATVTLTPTPDEGYELGGVTVTDRNGKPVAVTAGQDGRYTFTMPSGGVTIKAEFVKRQGGYAACPGDSSCPIWPYTDASPTAWYHDALHFCLENGLMQGYGQSLLGPGRSVSRAEFVQMLYNREGRPAAGGSLVFEDVPNGAWYGDAVRWASVRGITGGYGNGQFGPSRSITRQELAVMLWRYAGSPAATDKELHFADADKVSDYAREALGWAVEHGIVQGKSGGILDPGGNATRAEAAAMLQRFCGKEQ